MFRKRTLTRSASPRVAVHDRRGGTRRSETLVPPGKWVVDPARSQVSFDVRHLKVLHMRGHFAGFEGTVVCDGDGTAAISGTVSVESIETDDPKRDERLREADFFDTEHYPAISYEGVAQPVPADGSFEIRGRLTIKGEARELTLGAQREIADADADDDAVSIHAEGSVSRRDFGLDWEPSFAAGGLVIDDLVHMTLSVVVVRSGP